MPNEQSHGLARVAQTEVWFIDLAACGKTLRDWQDQSGALDRATMARLALIKHDDERNTRFAVHVALRVLIEQIAGSRWRGEPLMYTHRGQPSLPGVSLSLSLSHTRGAGLVALSPAPAVGVDIEPRDRRIKMQPDRQHAIISAANALTVCQSNNQSASPAFISAWVRLEAYAKATGAGLAPLLTEAMVPLRKKSLPTKPDNQDDGLIVHDLCPPDNFVAAVALARAELQPQVHLFPATASGLAELLATKSG